MTESIEKHHVLLQIKIFKVDLNWQIDLIYKER
jgi:hypothetical protein